MIVIASYETAYFHRAQKLIQYHVGATYRCLLEHVPRACQLTYGQVPIRVTDFEALTGNGMVQGLSTQMA